MTRRKAGETAAFFGKRQMRNIAAILLVFVVGWLCAPMAVAAANPPTDPSPGPTDPTPKPSGPIPPPQPPVPKPNLS